MAGYTPVQITEYKTGLIQEEEEFAIPDDAFTVLENAYIWRGSILRKQGSRTIGRLRRCFTVAVTLTNQASGTSYAVTDILNDAAFALRATEPNAQIEAGSVTITVDGKDLVEPAVPDGTLSDSGTNTGTINYATGALSLTFDPMIGASNVDVVMCYFPSLPVMGIRLRERNNINLEAVVYFDTTYAYVLSGGEFEEFIAGTTWSGSNSDFFWSTNYWVDASNNKLMWVTNFPASATDPIRYTNATNWHTFAPAIDSSGNELHQAKIILPFRGRLLALNTREGATLGTSVAFRQRIRWSAIGNPLTVVNGDVTVVNANAWNDVIIGQGGFLDIPTAENIVTAGFVRDNLVIYCERSTWQLRYTGRSIAPFQIEKVNTELGAESTFSAINFDTSLVGIGDKGIVECDSFKSERIDSKIPDLVFRRFHSENNGLKRVHGVRDITKRLAYWIYPDSVTNGTFPNRRLVLNYDNGSWAIFKDSFTALGTFQLTNDVKWQDIKSPWQTQNRQWVARQGATPEIVSGNQQGFILEIDNKVDNDSAFYIKSIVGDGATATVIESPGHNLQSGDVIKITDIPVGTGYVSLNDVVYGVALLTSDPTNKFTLNTYNSTSDTFSDNQVDALQSYVGNGKFKVLDNFSIVSKKYTHMETGQKIQLGYIDVHANSTSLGAFNLKLIVDYRNDNAVNKGTDTFFNRTIPTVATGLGVQDQSKYWHRVFCNVRANFIQIEYNLSNSQMNGDEQENDVQIDAQVLYQRQAGRLGI